MSAEVYYIVVAMMFASATLFVIFFLAWKNLGRKPYALSWSIGFLAATLQWFCSLNSHWFTNHESYWMTVNALGLILITLGIRGHCQRTNCQYLTKYLWPIVGLIYGGIFLSTVVWPHVGINTAILPAVTSITLYLSAVLIIRHREITRPAEWAAATGMILVGFLQCIAAGMAAMQGAAGDAVYQVLFVHYNFMVMPAGFMATGMLIIFMLASDLSEEMKEIALRDQLTGLLNRRGLVEQGSIAYEAADRRGEPLAVIMTDIDRFKHINDQHGHAVGDDALSHFASLLTQSCRPADILARVGGEEFAFILPGVDLHDAMGTADALCQKIEATRLRFDGRSLRMTASFGVTVVSAKDNSLADTLIRADRALYRSKRAGRNQVDLESSQHLRTTNGNLKSIAQ